jgi:hypothetical protein
VLDRHRGLYTLGRWVFLAELPFPSSYRGPA